jgi:RNA polymerase sigma factor (sigma-70 family)
LKRDSQSFTRIGTSTAHIEESTLIASLRAKDKLALAYLYDHYSGALYGAIYRIVQKGEIAEEVLQDVFLKIWSRIDSYDSAKGRLFTWMLNLAKNQAIDKTRSKEISRENKTGGIENYVSDVKTGEFAEQQVDSIGLSEVLARLPEDQRFIVDHLYLRGYTQAELADEFSIPLGTVKTRLRIAMKQLRLILKT